MHIVEEAGIDFARCPAKHGYWFIRPHLWNLRVRLSVDRLFSDQPTSVSRTWSPVTCPQCRAWAYHSVTVDDFAAAACESCNGMFIKAYTFDNLETWQPYFQRRRTLPVCDAHGTVVEVALFVDEHIRFAFELPK